MDYWKDSFTTIETVERGFIDGKRRKLTEAENAAFFAILLSDVEKLNLPVESIRNRCLAQRNVSIEKEATIIRAAINEIRVKLGPFNDG